MIEVHRGAGILVPIFGILSALVMNIVTIKFLSDQYYQEQRWPKVVVLILAGICCLATGLLLKRKRAREAPKEQGYIDSLSTKFPAAKRFAFSGPRDVHTAPILVRSLSCGGDCLRVEDVVTH